MSVEIFQPKQHLTQMSELINAHLGTVVPGMALPEAYIEHHLHINPHQPVIDPWVVERQTLVVMHRSQVVGAAHLLRYGTEAHIGENYHGAVDIAWMVFHENRAEAAGALLDACHAQMDAWHARHRYAFDSQFSVSIFGGIASTWPHIAALFESAGYTAARGGGAVYGGTLDAIPAPGDAPVPGMTMQRIVRRDNPAFVALIDGKEVGFSEWMVDLTRGGALHAMRGWAELTELFVYEDWRNRGVGAWLIAHAAQWLRLAHIDRVMLNVDSEDDANGAGRFYGRRGWTPFAYFRDGWQRR